MNNNPNALDFIYQDINDLKDEIRSLRTIIEERVSDPETSLHKSLGIPVDEIIPASAVMSRWDIIKKIEVLEIEINTLKTLLNKIYKVVDVKKYAPS